MAGLKGQESGLLKTKKKEKGKGRRKWQRRRLRGLWRNPFHWNFGWLFGRPNDVRFGSNFEKMFYSTR